MNDRSPFFNGTFCFRTDVCSYLQNTRVCITFFQEIYIRNSELNKTQLSSSPSPRYAILAIRFLTFDWLASFQVQSRFWFDICIKSTIYMYTRIRVCEVQIAILIAHSMHRDTECNVVNCILTCNFCNGTGDRIVFLIFVEVTKWNVIKVLWDDFTRSIVRNDWAKSKSNCYPLMTFRLYLLILDSHSTESFI